MRIHPYFRMLPRVRLYIAKPMRAGCISSTSLLLVLALLGIVSRLHGQVDAVLQFHGVDAQFNVGNPTAKPLQVSIVLFRDTTLEDSVRARVSPRSFLLQPGASQIVRIRLLETVKSVEGFRLATTFLPQEDEPKAQPTMHFVLATRLIVRVKAVP
jgi:P pilus assembly chaperone PapD